MAEGYCIAEEWVRVELAHSMATLLKATVAVGSSPGSVVECSLMVIVLFTGPRGYAGPTGYCVVYSDDGPCTRKFSVGPGGTV